MEEQYFQADDEKNSNLICQKLMKNYFLTFRFSHLLKFFTYHFMYNLVLGPLFIPILYLAKGPYFVKNLLFTHHWMAYFQGFLYCLYITAIGIYATLFSDPECTIFRFGEIVILLASQINLVTMISIKYATFDPVYI